MNRSMRWLLGGAICTLGLLAAGCVRVQPVRVQVDPINVTVNLNVKVQKVDAALENFFGDVSSAKNSAPAAESSQTQEKKP